MLILHYIHFPTDLNENSKNLTAREFRTKEGRGRVGRGGAGRGGAGWNWAEVCAAWTYRVG